MYLLIVLINVLVGLPGAAGEIAISHSGGVWIVDVESGEQREIAHTGYDRPLAWSPDGEHLVYWKHSAVGWDLWRTDSDGTGHENLTNVESGGCRSATYAPDGSRIAYMRDHPAGVYLMDADGGSRRQLTVNGHRDSPPVWSPDGELLAFTYFERGGTPNAQLTVAVVPTTSETRQPNAVRFEREIGAGDAPRFSNDGHHLRWLRIVGTRTHVFEVQVAGMEDALPGVHPLAAKDIKTLDAAARDPVWSPDGSHVAYWAHRNGDSGYELRIASISPERNGDEASGQSGTVALAVADEWRGPVSWSPDGEAIAFCAQGVEDMETPGDGVFMVASDGSDLRRIVETDAWFVAWRPTVDPD